MSTTASKNLGLPWASWQLALQLQLRRLGWPVLLGIALSLAAVVVWLALPQARQQLQSTRLALAHAQSTQSVSKPQAAPDQLGTLYQVLDQGRDRDQDLAQLFALAREEGWDLAQADYRLLPQNQAGLQRLQIQLPLTGSYADVRDLCKALLRGKPNLSLDELSFKRDNADQVNIEVTLKLSLWARLPVAGEGKP